MFDNFIKLGYIFLLKGTGSYMTFIIMGYVKIVLSSLKLEVIFLIKLLNLLSLINVKLISLNYTACWMAIVNG